MATASCWEGRDFSPSVQAALMKVSMTRRRLVWLDYYFGPANLNGTEAARLAKFKNPERVSSLLSRELAPVIDAMLLERSELLRLDNNKILEGIGDIAKHGESETNRLKAFELLAKIHGMMNDKLSINLDRRSLLKQLELLLPGVGNQIKEISGNTNRKDKKKEGVIDISVVDLTQEKDQAITVNQHNNDNS